MAAAAETTGGSPHDDRVGIAVAEASDAPATGGEPGFEVDERVGPDGRERPFVPRTDATPRPGGRVRFEAAGRRVTAVADDHEAVVRVGPTA